ncbi:rhodanese [Sporosarcina sp. P37]|uniref:rhodanese-like domain-containing protein n=1 Tax=unclassified Sporosarcina TaxID=2647733 RepID=UPI0009BFAD2F|nr:MULTISPECIES: rhodanese-like domain-containing protein [unclassified Sporosarcina]ARD47453.1 rhodanese [Sporosarcina sp. P33]ARK24023.1 rhodanese [Sporosarcina sp. P37]PID18587.1 rhodanese-like domain-containing protein [Sporosarcina sp. P35]
MGWIFIALIVIAVVWRMKPAKGVNIITTEELKGRMKDRNVQFIDVRTPAEYKERHIPLFKNIPLNLLKNQMASLPKEQEIILICQSGMRSMNAAGQLKKAGYTNVTNVRGGMSAWRE